MRRIFFITLYFLPALLHAQNVNSWSSQFSLPELTSIYYISEPVEKIEQLLKEERDSQSNMKSLVFAVGMETSINPLTSGQWDTIPAKGYVWRLGIKAENALSLNILVENYLMQPEMTLYVYDQTKENTAGPFDSKNNSNGGVLPVQSLPGNMIIVEWNIPMQASPTNSFTISSIGYGFRDMRKIISLASAACNIDVNCITGNRWQREKRSVVLMQTILQSGRTQYCSGTLINQAVNANRKKPYILTANHCIATLQEAQRTTFFFGYEKDYCDGVAPERMPGITGSSLVATKRELDFSLLEMSSISNEHRPFYAGWTISNVAPQEVVGIHHPQGDVKKISVANSAVTSGTFNDPNSNLFCDRDAHWIVRRWNEGVTENGSSGSPIFDAEHKIVGLLSGGSANCSNPINDFYSKFYEQWNKYRNENESLRPWLDPENRGVTSVWGYDPVSTFEGRYNFTGNIGDNEAETINKSGLWGYLTSRNDRNWTSFAEKIINDSIANIIGVEANIAKISEPGVTVRFAVWSGTELPATLLEWKDVTVTADYKDHPIRVYFDSMVAVEGDFFIGYSLENTSLLDTFALYHSTIRPYPGIAGMYVEEIDGRWTNLEDYSIYASLGIKMMGKLAKRIQPSFQLQKNNELNIIYQQGTDTALALFDIDGSFPSFQTITIECYDVSGKRMFSLSEVMGRMDMYDDKAYLQVELNVGSLPPGIYLIQTFDGSSKQTGKFVKIY